VQRFDPEGMLRVLEGHEVRYVVIGGLAATLHGSPLRTGDAGICPATDLENRERLAAALREMDAKIRTPDVPGGLPFPCDAAFLGGVLMLNLVTRHGDLHRAFHPSGTERHADLVAGSIRYDLDGLIVPVASLADVIRSKRAAGRQKDRESLPTLEALQRRLGPGGAGHDTSE